MNYVCPICDFNGEFIDFGGREAARCPTCGGLERHRVQWLAFKTSVLPRLPKGPLILHTTPESGISRKLRSLTTGYTGTDIKGGGNLVAADLTALPMPDSSFDFVWSSHVLEHIEDAQKAISEIFRVLKPSGLALLDVPVSFWKNGKEKYRKRTIKNASRDEHGHWWKPGMDWADFYEAAGFAIEAHFSPESIEVLQRPPTVIDLVLCSKPE